MHEPLSAGETHGIFRYYNHSEIPQVYLDQHVSGFLWLSLSSSAHAIRYDSGYLTCSKKLTGSQLSLPSEITTSWPFLSPVHEWLYFSGHLECISCWVPDFTSREKCSIGPVNLWSRDHHSWRETAKASSRCSGVTEPVIETTIEVEINIGLVKL